VTRGGPSSIPEGAIASLTAAADLVSGTDRVVTVKLAHGELVPRAGRLAIDCHLGVAANRAVLCLVVRGGSEPRKTTAALQVGLRAIEPMISRALKGGSDKPTAFEGASGKASKRIRDTAPHITVEPARRVGAETVAAIRQELDQHGSHVPSPHIPRDMLRTTLPWKESQKAPQEPSPPATTTSKGPRSSRGKR